MAKTWEKQETIALLKRILIEHGENISGAKYDSLTIDKPNTTTLRRMFGTWEEAKRQALPDATTINKNYLLKQNQQLMERLEAQRNITQVFIDNCLAEITKKQFKPIKVPSRITTKENLDFHAMRSDAQVGQYLDSAHVQGLSHYSADTYQERVTKWTEKVIKFKRQDQTSLGLNKLVIHHLGDQVEGENIFKGQSFYLDLSLTEQLFFSVEVETNSLLRLAQVFPEIEVFCVIGNHGRPGQKGENHNRTNFDYIFYRCLQTATANQKNIKVYVSESPTMIVQHGSFIFLLNHGDQAKSWNGIPYYGLERMFRKLPDLYNMIIHYELCGHHHQASNLVDRIIMNGCLPGGSEYSINTMGLTSIPSQKIFYFHPSKGINRESNLYLDSAVKLEKDKNGIFTKYTK